MYEYQCLHGGGDACPHKCPTPRCALRLPRPRDDASSRGWRAASSTLSPASARTTCAARAWARAERTSSSRRGRARAFLSPSSASAASVSTCGERSSRRSGTGWEPRRRPGSAGGRNVPSRVTRRKIRSSRASSSRATTRRPTPSFGGRRFSVCMRSATIPAAFPLASPRRCASSWRGCLRRRRPPMRAHPVHPRRLVEGGKERRKERNPRKREREAGLSRMGETQRRPPDGGGEEGEGCGARRRTRGARRARTRVRSGHVPRSSRARATDSRGRRVRPRRGSPPPSPRVRSSSPGEWRRSHGRGRHHGAPGGRAGALVAGPRPGRPAPPPTPAPAPSRPPPSRASASR